MLPPAKWSRAYKRKCSGCREPGHRIEKCPQAKQPTNPPTGRRRGQSNVAPPPVDLNDPEVIRDLAMYPLLEQDRPKTYADCLTTDELRQNPGWLAEQALRAYRRLPVLQATDGINCERPCPWVSCRFHLYLDVSPLTGKIGLAFPDREVWDLNETCALDFVRKNSDGARLEDVSAAGGVTRERIRQIETHGLRNLRRFAQRNPGIIYLPDYRRPQSAGEMMVDVAPGDYGIPRRKTSK